MFKMSVLDQSPVRTGGEAPQALEETITLAKLCDEWGYHRFWVSEHHASNALAGCSPEVLLARLGAETKRIRLGSGGVMLPHYSPYKVAENFKLLEALYPGRIDLGVGRAPGTDPFTAAALRYGAARGPEHFPSMVSDLSALLRDESPTTRGMEQARAFPKVEHVPELWMLSSSEDSAYLAAEQGLPYSFAYFINPNISPDIFDIYRKRFKSSATLSSPYTSLGIFVICADTEEEALRLSRSRDLWFVRLLRGDPGPFPSVEEAEAYPYSQGELEMLAHNRSKRAVGTPEQVKAKLMALQEQFGIDEFVVVSITFDFEARLKSYELLADAFSL
ncbi:LLM class flavin-dependent oxidoreductase [Aurantivibrio plasticivorans]